MTKGRWHKKNYYFVITNCCQGQPFEYYRKTLFGALYEYAKQYLTKKKYHTMNFSLKQRFGAWVERGIRP